MTELVGRTADRVRLRVVLRQLRDGLSAVLVVSGVAGIGKTRLLQWAADTQILIPGKMNLAILLPWHR